jgi:hypothetical protein
VTHPTQWEYLTLAADAAADLNDLGKAGWELTGVSNGTLYFKRPALTFREQVTLDQKRHYYGMLGVPLGDEKGPSA